MKNLDKAAKALGIPSPEELYHRQLEQITPRVAKMLPNDPEVQALVKIKWSRNIQADWARMAPEFMKKGIEIAALGQDPPSKWAGDIMKLAMTQVVKGGLPDISEDAETDRLAQRIFKESKGKLAKKRLMTDKEVKEVVTNVRRMELEDDAEEADYEERT